MKWFIVSCLVMIWCLLVAGATEAATISITLQTLDPQNVTLSDTSGEYFDDWRIWENDGGSPGIADEKKAATNIGDLSVSQSTVDGGNSHRFNYTDDDAQDGSGAIDFAEAVKLIGGQSTVVNLSFSVSDIGPEGTLYVYSAGWSGACRLDAEIGSDSDSVSRPYYKDAYSDWWEIEYSDVTGTDTLDIFMTSLTGSSYWHDLQLSAVALDVVPEPSAWFLTLLGMLGMCCCGWRRCTR